MSMHALRSLQMVIPLAFLGLIPVDTVAHGQEAVTAETRSIEPVLSRVEQVDAVFAPAVEFLNRWLFRRVFRETRQFIEFAEVDYYREQGSDDAYRQLNPAAAGPESLSQHDVAKLSARGLVTRSSGPGRLDGQPVEFLTIRLRQGRYIRGDDGVYRREISRGRVSDTETLTQPEVDGLAKQNELATDADANPAAPHLQTDETYGGAPFVVLWLSLGAVFFTIAMGFYNFRGFFHAIEIVRGKYDNPEEPGEVSHFQALASALSATVGLGNIAGVTIAMTVGGPGAFFWMMACGFFGMTSKFVECTLGQKYRRVKEDGTVLGGPMQYLHAGLKELGLGPIGFVMSILFAIMCILASFGGGNMFQANQSRSQVLSVLQMQSQERLQSIDREMLDLDEAADADRLTELRRERLALVKQMGSFDHIFRQVYGIILAIFVGIVIIGGIKRIGAAAGKIVPSMCLVYLAACLYIIVANIALVPQLVAQIFSEAFNPTAFGGGFLGILVVGVQRAAFSNEAGVGSAAIAHSAARTEEPVREGTVALLGPFIDTIVVCSMTALVILITNAWNNTTWTDDLGLEGAALTTKAFSTQISWFPYVLMVAVVLFAYSTLISWSYYGERCWERLFGPRSTFIYKILYVGAVFVGSMLDLGAVLDFSDMMILSMAFPNILGLVLLTPKVRRDLNDYWRRYQANEFRVFK